MSYGYKFAKIYNKKWIGFVELAAPKILDFYERKIENHQETQILDLGCGTGQFVSLAAQRRYKIIGVDKSANMLKFAKSNNRQFYSGKLVRFNEADIVEYCDLKEKFSLIVSTYDVINHLNSLEEIERCFHNAFEMSKEKCYFIFDINTIHGLKNCWNNVQVNEYPNEYFIQNGLFDEEKGLATTRVVGFVNKTKDYYYKFEEIFYNKAYRIKDIENLLIKTGWKNVYQAKLQNLEEKIDDPENQYRVFFVAKNF